MFKVRQLVSRKYIFAQPIFYSDQIKQFETITTFNFRSKQKFLKQYTYFLELTLSFLSIKVDTEIFTVKI